MAFNIEVVALLSANFLGDCIAELLVLPSCEIDQYRAPWLDDCQCNSALSIVQTCQDYA